MHPLTIDTYCRMLREINSSRTAISYSAIEHHDEFILWRHDCDMSLNRALRFARLDAEHGVYSTFFVGVHSDFYNIFERSQTQIVREIRELGHGIGLHFDSSYHSTFVDKYDIEASLENDTRYLQDVAECEIKAFSFHNPSSEDLGYEESIYAGLINCYSRDIQCSVEYASDSNGYWRYQPIPDVIQDQSKKKLQILTHPEWWLEKDCLPRDHMLRCVYGRALSTVSEYDRVLSEHNDRENQKSDDGLNDYERATRLM